MDGWVNGVWNGCVVRFCLALHLDPRQLADLPSSATPWQALVGYIQPRVQHPKGTIPTVQLIASVAPPCPIAGSQVKASPRFSNEKRRKSKVDEARDILAHVVVCHVAAPKYNFTHKLAYVSVRPGQSL